MLKAADKFKLVFAACVQFPFSFMTLKNSSRLSALHQTPLPPPVMQVYQYRGTDPKQAHCMQSSLVRDDLI